MLSEQPGVGDDDRKLKPVIGIHLLDFALFDQPEHADQALWCFELRDRTRPDVRLGHLPERLSAWIAYFEHWQEETLMSSLNHPPVPRSPRQPGSPWPKSKPCVQSTRILRRQRL